MPDFESGAFNRSAISPRLCFQLLTVALPTRFVHCVVKLCRSQTVRFLRLAACPFSVGIPIALCGLQVSIDFIARNGSVVAFSFSFSYPGKMRSSDTR